MTEKPPGAMNSGWFFVCAGSLKKNASSIYSFRLIETRKNRREKHMGHMYQFNFGGPTLFMSHEKKIDGRELSDIFDEVLLEVAGENINDLAYEMTYTFTKGFPFAGFAYYMEETADALRKRGFSDVPTAIASVPGAEDDIFKGKIEGDERRVRKFRTELAMKFPGIVKKVIKMYGKEN